VDVDRPALTAGRGGVRISAEEPDKQTSPAANLDRRSGHGLGLDLSEQLGDESHSAGVVGLAKGQPTRHATFDRSRIATGRDHEMVPGWLLAPVRRGDLRAQVPSLR
jgi:hypothetical protein